MGRNQKKKKGWHAQQTRRAGASAATMAPVPLSLGGTSAGDSCSGSLLLKLESTSCKHVESGVNLGKLREQFAREPPAECHDCIRGRPSRLKDEKGRAKVAAKKALWICLACGQIGCNAHTSEAKDGDQIVGPLVDHSHAMMHSKAWMHPVVMQWGESLDCWCLRCNAQLIYAGVCGGGSGVSVDNKSTKVGMQPELLQRATTLLQGSIFRNSSTLKVGDVDTEQVTEVEPEVEGSMPSSKPTVEAVNLPVSPKLTPGLVTEEELLRRGSILLQTSLLWNPRTV